MYTTVNDVIEDILKKDKEIKERALVVDHALRDFAKAKGYMMVGKYNFGEASTDYLFENMAIDGRRVEIKVGWDKIENAYLTVDAIVDHVKFKLGSPTGYGGYTFDNSKWLKENPNLIIMGGRANGKTEMMKRLMNSVYGVRRQSGPCPWGYFSIKKVIFNDPATIVIWADGTKTVVKTQNGEIFDPEKGLAMAIAKKALGNKREYYHTFKHWVKKYEKQSDEITSIEEFREKIEEMQRSFKG